jgi:hypothetical protein
MKRYVLAKLREHRAPAYNLPAFTKHIVRGCACVCVCLGVGKLLSLEAYNVNTIL